MSILFQFLIKIISYVLRSVPRAVAVLAMVVYVVGSVLTLYYGLPEPFQRFGSLGSAGALLFFTDRKSRIELSRQRSVEAMLHEYAVRFEALRAGTPAQDIPDVGYTTDLFQHETGFAGLRKRADKIDSLNVVILSIATLQWGFGDLALKALM